MRTTNGESEMRFYCRLCRSHISRPSAYEIDHRNPGICDLCSELVLSLMRDHGSKWATLDKREFEQRLGEDERERKHRKSVERLARGSTDPGWVYYVEQGDLIKIGYSANPLGRMKSYGPTAHLMAVHPGTLALEKEIHAQFRRYLARGREWFSRHEVVLAHVASVRERFGDPSVFAYAYTIPPEKRGSGVSQRKTSARFQLVR
ncbi:MAG TPA: GIY-YIG nuclease family protein [Microbacteriaceae bacterium]|nr:GIY-YIG nuclease family protein [Microbacteriaceae bacterium]